MDSVAAEVLTVVKAGQSETENEDFASVRADEGVIRIALADGATEAAFSRDWARALVGASLGSDVPDIVTSLHDARAAWLRDIPPRDTLPWFGQAKLDDGSLATMAVVNVQHRKGRYRWDAQFVGDCEVFVLSTRGSLRLRNAAPFDGPDGFGTTPESDRSPIVSAFHGSIAGPAELWIVSDAFAHAMLQAHLTRRRPWKTWSRALGSLEAFAFLVDRWRDAGWMRNDDVTVVRVILP